MKAVILIIAAALFASPVLSQTNFTSVAAAVAGTPTLSILSQYFNATSLYAILNNGTPPATGATIFAPSDSAFQARLAASNTTVAEVIEGAKRSPSLQYSLRFHVVPGVALTAASLTDGQVLPNLLDVTLGPNGNPYGYSLTINKAGSNVTVRNTQTTPRATITTADITAGQSILHIIDNVLTYGAPAPAPAPGSLPTLG